MDITNIIGFTAGFTFTDRATGEVLLEASADDAAALQTLVESGSMVPGKNKTLDVIAKLTADACVGEVQIDVDADNGATAFAIYERVGSALGFAKMVGMDVNDAFTFASKADDLPAINVRAMAEVANPLIELVSNKRSRSAMAAAQTHPTTKSIH